MWSGCPLDVLAKQGGESIRFQERERIAGRCEVSCLALRDLGRWLGDGELSNSLSLPECR